ncbi:hypothetical protein [Gimesia sp.]|uniref:hypothetical protein n=1 Tax=Gimesia sp. TaxID=2024833 RepID=UPI003A93E7D7
MNIRNYRRLKKLSGTLSIFIIIGFSITAVGLWWYTWPSRTWESFLIALSKDDAQTANSYCDTDTIRVKILNDSIHFYIRPNKQGDFLDYPMDHLYEYNFSLFRTKNGPRASNFWQIMTANVPLTGPKEIWYGHLNFKRGKIHFSTDSS